MYIRLYILLIISVLTLPSCQKSRISNAQWAQTEAVILVEQNNKQEEEYMYTIQYNASGSTAVDREGKKINGLIQQHSLSEKKPVHGQRLKIEYVKEEPIIFKFLEPIRYEK